MTRDRSNLPVTIRPYRPGDAEALVELYRQSVEQVGAADYTSAQVAAWAGLVPTAAESDARCRDGRTTLVAVDEADRPVAFGDVEADGHIGFLYCAPAAAGRGVAAAIYTHLEEVARRNGAKRLYAEASEAARRFFLKQGFTVTARRDFEVGGVPIHNYAVEKRL